LQNTKGGRSSDGEESPDTTGQIVQSKGWMPQGKPAVRRVPQKANRPATGKGEKAVQETTVPCREARRKANPFRCKAK